MTDSITINTAYTQLSEDLNNDPIFNITAEEASKRLSDAIIIERESLKNIGISVRLLTLHDNWKYWESMGMDRTQFEKTSIYAYGNHNKAMRSFEKAFNIEITHRLIRGIIKLKKAIRGNQ